VLVPAKPTADSGQVLTAGRLVIFISFNSQ